VCVLAARSTPNLSCPLTDDIELDASAKYNQKAEKERSGRPAIIRLPSLEDDWLTSFFARRPITDVDNHDVTVHDLDIVSSCSAAV